ncbi:Purkinje cell protein 2 homolog isoform X1 [Apteryx mantelli]|uniref:Purkinje cell protein 2 homolog isoform X1 n=1 Tax=Apteryx mantelli TaxID=2696672 RepID=A0ABM4G7R8_9AVES
MAALPGGNEAKKEPAPGSDQDSEAEPPEQSSFFALLSSVQGSRMEQQRCSLPAAPGHGHGHGDGHGLGHGHADGDGAESLLELLAHVQGRRMDERRLPVAQLPGFPPPKK